jgi:hypothetical protein
MIHISDLIIGIVFLIIVWVGVLPDDWKYEMGFMAGFLAMVVLGIGWVVAFSVFGLHISLSIIK